MQAALVQFPLLQEEMGLVVTKPALHFKLQMDPAVTGQSGW
jgi:hypothetical protein